MPQNSRSALVTSGKGTPPLQIPERCNCSQPGRYPPASQAFSGLSPEENRLGSAGFAGQQPGAEASLHSWPSVTPTLSGSPGIWVLLPGGGSQEDGSGPRNFLC